MFCSIIRTHQGFSVLKVWWFCFFIFIVKTIEMHYIMALFCVVLCWTFVVWFVHVVLCCQRNSLPTHKHAQIYSPPFLWHFCSWWLMSGDDHVAYCCSIELTVQNSKFCGGDGERCVVDCWQWQQRWILISILM